MNIDPVLDQINANRGLGSSNACYDVMYFVARLYDCQAILEIGTHRGASAIVFCRAVLDNGGVPRVVTIDSWEQADRRDVARAHFAKAGVAEWVCMVEGRSDDVLPGVARQRYWDLVLIDGGHAAAQVRRDYENVKGHTRRILFHDTDAAAETPYLLQAAQDGFRLRSFHTRYVEGDGHPVGITLAERRGPHGA